MAGKKKASAKKASTKQKPMTTNSFAKSKGGTKFEHPVSTTGASHVYQADMGESLPPQGQLLTDKK